MWFTSPLLYKGGVLIAASAYNCRERWEAARIGFTRKRKKSRDDKYRAAHYCVHRPKAPGRLPPRRAGPRADHFRPNARNRHNAKLRSARAGRERERTVRDRLPDQSTSRRAGNAGATPDPASGVRIRGRRLWQRAGVAAGRAVPLPPGDRGRVFRSAAPRGRTEHPCRG